MRVQFGDVIMDDGARRLQRAGRPVHVSPKAFDLLVTLIQERPRVIPKEALHAKLWPDTFVSDASLAMLVAEIRGAIGDSARNPRWVRTVHRRGYAFDAAEPSSVVDLGVADASALPPGGGPEYWLVGPLRRIRLVPGPNIAGREPGCQAWIDSPSVSRRHARIVVTGDRVTVEDLGSKNGTFVGRSPVSAPTVVSDGDMIRFGSEDFALRTWTTDPTLTEGGS